MILPEDSGRPIYRNSHVNDTVSEVRNSQYSAPIHIISHFTMFAARVLIPQSTCLTRAVAGLSTTETRRLKIRTIPRPPHSTNIIRFLVKDAHYAAEYYTTSVLFSWSNGDDAETNSNFDAYSGWTANESGVVESGTGMLGNATSFLRCCFHNILSSHSGR